MKIESVMLPIHPVYQNKDCDVCEWFVHSDVEGVLRRELSISSSTAYLK